MSFGSLRPREKGSSPFHRNRDFPKYSFKMWPCTSVLHSKFPVECLYIVNSSKGFFDPSVAKLRGKSWEVYFIYLPISDEENSADLDVSG